MDDFKIEFNTHPGQFFDQNCATSPDGNFSDLEKMVSNYRWYNIVYNICNIDTEGLFTYIFPYFAS